MQCIKIFIQLRHNKNEPIRTSLAKIKKRLPKKQKKKLKSGYYSSCKGNLDYSTQTQESRNNIEKGEEKNLIEKRADNNLIEKRVPDIENPQ